MPLCHFISRYLAINIRLCGKPEVREASSLLGSTPSNFELAGFLAYPAFIAIAHDFYDGMSADDGIATHLLSLKNSQYGTVDGKYSSSRLSLASRINICWIPFYLFAILRSPRLLLD